MWKTSQTSMKRMSFVQPWAVSAPPLTWRLSEATTPTGWPSKRVKAVTYDAFGLIGTTFRELDWQTLIFFERAIPISPNTW